MLETGLSLPLFNVIKYFILFFAFDILVRISLDYLKAFIRAKCLNEGRSVPLSSSPIDRYGLSSHAIKKFTLLSLFIAVPTILTYGLEILLEFSSDSVVKEINVPGELFLVPADQGICELNDISTVDIGERMIDFAHQCITLDEDTGTYKIYKANWEVTDSNVFPSCVKTNENILINGSSPYDESTWITDEVLLEDADVSKLDSGPKSVNAVLLIQVNSSHVFFQRTFFNDQHITGGYRAQIPDSEIACFGNIFGRVGEGLIKLENRICIRGSWPFTDDTDLIFFPGTGIVYEDVANISTRDWSAPVVGTDFNGVKGLRKFAKGVTSEKFSSIETYMVFLGLTNNRDHRSLQRYAILFRECGLVNVPKLGAIPRYERVPNANSAPDVRVAVTKWALCIVIFWPALLLSLKFILWFYMQRHSLPKNVYGEKEIASLWYLDQENDCNPTGTINQESSDSESIIDIEDNSRKVFNWGGRGTQLYLSVDDSNHLDKILVTTSPKEIRRDKSKNFRSLDL